MNLRNYLGRELRLCEDFPYKWNYYPGEDLSVYSITIQEGNNTYCFPSYSLMLKVFGNRIAEILRITNHCTTPFPSEIEKMAEIILNKATYGSSRPMWNYSLTGEMWTYYLIERYNSRILKPEIFANEQFIHEGAKLYWRIPNQKQDMTLEIKYEERNNCISGFVCPKDAKIDRRINKALCNEIINYTRGDFSQWEFGPGFSELPGFSEDDRLE